MLWHESVNLALGDILLLGRLRGSKIQRIAKEKAQVVFTESKLPTKDPAALSWSCSNSV